MVKNKKQVVRGGPNSSAGITPASEKKVILLVEDNKDDVDLITRMLAAYFGSGQAVVHCGTMAEAEKYIGEHMRGIQSVILDLGLPDTANAYETFRRARRFSREIPVVIVTASRDHGLALKFVEEGAEDFISKDQLFHAPDALRNAIEFAVRRNKKVKDALAEKDQVISWMGGGYSIVRDD